MSSIACYSEADKTSRATSAARSQFPAKSASRPGCSLSGFPVQCWTVPAYISRGLSQRGETSPAKSHALTTTKEVTLRPVNGSLDAHDRRTGTGRPVQVIRSPPLSALDLRQAYGDGGGLEKVSGSGIAGS